MSDNVFSELAELPALDLDELGSARVRKRAHAALETKRLGKPVVSRHKHAFFYVQSTLIGLVATGYLFWVVESVLSPYR